jgi:hypothetical protein
MSSPNNSSSNNSSSNISSLSTFFDFYKYCNCYEYNLEKIDCECFSTIDDALQSFRNRDQTKKYIWSRLLYVNKLFPKIITNQTIKYNFGYGLINGKNVNVTFDDKK